MRCSIADCPGEYEQREVVRAVRQGERIIVIERIPAEVCNICDDVLFTQETIEQLEVLRQTTKAPVRMVPQKEQGMIRLRLKEVLEDKGVGMGKLSRLSDMSYSTIFRIVNDPMYSPSLHTLERIAKALNVPVSELSEEMPDD